MKIKARSRRLLQNPLWYVATVAGLIGLTAYLPLAWWLAGPVTLVWGLWLVAHVFGVQQPPVDGADRLQAYLYQARRYQAQITHIARQPDASPGGVHAEQLITQANVCTEAIAELVQHLTMRQQDDLVAQALVTLPTGIARLEERLATEHDAALAAQIEAVLRIRRDQQTALIDLQALLAQTELQLEYTLSCLGTIYCQLLFGQSTSSAADYRRLSLTLDEAVLRLADHLEALQEVKGVQTA